MAAPIRFLSGRNQQQKIGIEGSTENQKVLEVVGQVGIGTTIFEPSAELEVRGDVLVSGILTVGSITIGSGGGGTFQVDNLDVSGLSTFTGAIDANGDLDVDGHTELDNLNVSGLSTFTGAIDANGDLDVDGHTELDDVNISGVSTFAGAIDVNGDLDVDGHTELDDVNVSGAITATTFTGNLTGNADTATSLATARTFELTGDVVASQISFDGTGNVSLAATIQPNSVALGGDTTGDYVESVSGTANEIEVTGGTGEGSAPTIGFVANPTIGGNVNIGQDLTVTRDLKVTRNLNVDGTVTIGGTSATIFAETLKISDPDIILGFRTDAGGNDISNDTTANHGGVALASTEGSPLITLVNPGAGETLPSTYKKIMWFKTNSFTGLNTDAWLTNYAFGVGTTSMSAGTKFAVGNIEADFDDITSVRHINSTGVGTFTTLDIGTGGIDVDGHTELDNLNVSGASTFTGAIDANGDLDVDGHTELDNVNISGVTTASNTTIGFGNTEFIVDGDARITGVITANRIYSEVFGEFTGSSVVSGSLVGTGLSISGISTLGTVQISSGIVTATSGVVTYYGDGSNLVDLTGASAGTYGDSSSTAVIQVDSDGRITGIATTNIDGIPEISADTTPQLGGDLDLNGNDITGTGDINITGVVTATSFDGSIDFSKVTGVTTDISADTTPQLGGDLDLNGNDITGTGNINITGVATFSGNVTIGGTLTYEDVTNIDSIGLITARSGIIVNSGGINVSAGIVTAPAFTGFDYLQAPHGTTVNYSVTIASKTAAHRYNGSGSSNGYVINGVESPFLTFTPGRTYRFTLSSGDMSSHPFRFYLEADKTTQYTTNVTSTSTYTEIVVTDITPIVLHYQCSAHDYMGNAAQTNSNKLNTPYQIDGLKGANITGVVTATSFEGDGSNLLNLPTSGIVPTENTTNQEQFISFFTGTATTSLAGISSNKFVFNPSTTRLGIGTISPRANLDVTGSILVSTGAGVTFDTLIKAYSNESGSLSFEESDSSSQYFSISKDDSSSLFAVNNSSFETQFIVGAGGSVGVGITIPTAKLHVIGDAIITGTINGTSADGSVSNTENKIQPALFRTISGSTAGLGFTDTFAYNPSTNRLGIGTTSPRANLDVTSSILVSTGAGVTFDTLIKAYSNESGSLSFEESDSSSQYFSISKDDSSSLFAVNNSSFETQFIVGAGGSVGVGTTIPTAKLHVIGDAIITGTINGTSADGSVSNTENKIQPALFRTINGSTAGLGFTDTFAYNPSTTRLGIGTTSPRANLDVTGSILVSTGAGVTFDTLIKAYSNESGSLSFEESDSSSQYFSISKDDSSSLFAVNNSSFESQFIVGAGGSVGVGTENPTAKLHVIGDAIITGTINNRSNDITSNISNQNQTLTYVTGAASTTGFGVTDKLIYNPSTTRLGIGTTSPRANLDVTSSILVSTGAGVTFDTLIKAYSNESGSLSFEESDSSSQYFSISKDDSSSLFAINNSSFETQFIVGAGGSVGVGTENPTAKLHVIGDARVGFDTSQGVILTSPNSTQYRLIVDDSGNLSTIAV